MARIRNIKPEFFTSETVAALPLRARLTWIGLWVHCDNHGRSRDNVKLIKGAVWPLDDVSTKDIEIDLNTLADRGLIVRYEVDGKRYLMVTNWGEHQYGAFKDKPKYPPPELSTVDKSRDGLDESGPIQGLRVKGQGSGDARARASPPNRCPKHANNPNPPPCGACADARRAAETAETDHRVAIRRCKQCNLDGYRRIPGTGRMIEPPEVCTHDR